MTMRFINMPIGPVDFRNERKFVLAVTTSTDDIGFALFTQDAWYDTAASRQWFQGRSSYAELPTDALTRGKTRPRGDSDPAKKRWLHESLEGDIDDTIVDEGNITRHVTDLELWEVHDVIRCQSSQCESETE
ncbi:hypothetical protein PISL3812_06727 [Talaromyces islandicus]|uniref:Uncharacterized protein n=1 Tax=Talaromyces islandicus TaxID=28573 RepID=A0A0U1M280_TALIS|nr:hypothetical protein PISL3812_06727 [Talaromyces islandicus]